MTIPSEADFDKEALAFLDANASKRVEERLEWGHGRDKVAVFSEKSPEDEAKDVAAAKEWRAKCFDAGFGWITGPEQYGGRALPSSYERRWQALQSQYSTPTSEPYGIGLGMVAPTILAHGTDAAKDAYLRGMYHGEIIGCQLFSEPGSGSDLASLSTKAERDGDEWVINGQKVWTSNAQYADIGEIICRTDPDAPKHKGLGGFVVNMRAPGVEVRPLRQMTGGASFNEVFFTDVRVPADHLLGDVNGGWTVALTTLMNERASIGGGGGGSGATGPVRLAQMMKAMGVSSDPIRRQEWAQIYINGTVARLTSQRGMAKIRAGQLPGPEMSTGKLALTLNMQRTAQFVANVLGPRLVADTGAWGTYSWSEYVLGVPGMRVAGGTDEIMRNILGERVLGLPKDPQ